MCAGAIVGRIAHLGHLHHTLTQAQFNALGRIDVVMAPVDGNYTLDRFLKRAQREWPIERAEVPSVVVSKAMLPKSPKVLVLPGF